MGALDEINVMRLFDQAEPGVGGHDAVDLRGLVTRKDHEEIGGGSDAPGGRRGGTVVLLPLP